MSVPNFKLKELRFKHKLKQTDMAKILQMSETTYVRKENGATEFTESEIYTICKLFNKHPSDIFFNGELTKTTNEQIGSQ